MTMGQATDGDAGEGPDGADIAAGAPEDRLPWLESAEVEDEEGPSVWRVLGMILLGLALTLAAIFVFTGLQRRNAANAPQVAGSEGGLIKAPEGPYKTKPDAPGGMKVEGEGDTVFATSEGGAKSGSVDVSKVPEAPVAGKTVAPPKPADKGSARVVAAVPASGGPIAAKAPPATARPATQPGGGSAVVQLGSFPTESGANSAWAALSKRFGYLAPLGKAIERADVNGSTVFRLRVNAGSATAASELCGKLKVAGENCFIPR